MWVSRFRERDTMKTHLYWRSAYAAPLAFADNHSSVILSGAWATQSKFMAAALRTCQWLRDVHEHAARVNALLETMHSKPRWPINVARVFDTIPHPIYLAGLLGECTDYGADIDKRASMALNSMSSKQVSRAVSHSEWGAGTLPGGRLDTGQPRYRVF